MRILMMSFAALVAVVAMTGCASSGGSAGAESDRVRTAYVAPAHADADAAAAAETGWTFGSCAAETR